MYTNGLYIPIEMALFDVILKLSFNLLTLVIN